MSWQQRIELLDVILNSDLEDLYMIITRRKNGDSKERMVSRHMLLPESHVQAAEAYQIYLNLARLKLKSSAPEYSLSEAYAHIFDLGLRHIDMERIKKKPNGVQH